MRQINGNLDVTGFVVEENSGPTDKNGKHSVLKLEFSIIIEKEHNPNPGSDERKKKKHRRAVQGGKGAGGLDLRSGGGPSEEAKPSVTKNKEGKKTKSIASTSSFPLVMVMMSWFLVQIGKSTPNVCSDPN
jgi:hypothetical protein